MKGLKLLVEGARADFLQWRLRLEAAKDTGRGLEVLCFCADRLEDAREWWQACGWVLEEARVEERAGGPGRFCDTGHLAKCPVSNGAAH